MTAFERPLEQTAGGALREADTPLPRPPLDRFEWADRKQRTVKLPLVPVKEVKGCVWHVPPGQWWITICQDSADGGSVPCSGSVAEPE